VKVSSLLISGFNPAVPKDLTAKDLRCIIGLDTRNGFVKMSMETWKRLELFIDILGSVDFTCYEMAVEDLLNRHRSMFDVEELQQAAPGSSEGEMAYANLCAAGENSKAALLPDLRPGISP